MLYWICPECGHECSPAVRECPTCTASTSSPPAKSTSPEPAAAAFQTEASNQLLALAHNFEAPAQRPPMAATNGHEPSSLSAVAVAEEVIAPPSTEPEPAQELAPLDKNSTRPARPGPIASLVSSPAPVPTSTRAPAFAPTAPHKNGEFTLAPAGWTPAGEISFQAVPGGGLNVVSPAVEPLPSSRRSVAFRRAPLQASDRSGTIPTGELAQLSLVVSPANSGSKSGPAPSPASAGATPFFVASGLRLGGESLRESLAGLLNALKTSAEELERSSIEAIRATFEEQPSLGLLPAPAEIVTAPAPAATQWLRSGKLKLYAVPPEYTGRTAVLAGPQPPTLAGPSLPPQLLNLDRLHSGLGRHRQRWAKWPLSFVGVTIVILGLVSALQYLIQDRDTKAATAGATVQVAKAASAPHLPVLQEHPAARSVEVAGIRILTLPNKKPQLQFIVINHSASELTGLNIRIGVRSVDTPSDAPLFTVSSVIAALGPNQSKEVRTDVSSAIPASEIPDWQSLRTEVLIGRQ
jgi:hypothetical protein